MLFGEYTVIHGSKALAAPHAGYWGCWSDHPDWEAHLQQPRYQTARLCSRDALRTAFSYLQEQQAAGHLSIDWNLAKLDEELEQGLWFYSRIPTGYGLGSSGAFSCALLERYTDFVWSQRQERLSELRLLLAEVENCFHGESSGLDPLVSYLAEPILIKEGMAHPVELPKAEGIGGVFLLNTKRARETSPLVRLYLEKCESPTFKDRCVQELSEHNDRAIEALLQGNRRACLEAARQISSFQRRYFEEMIPKEYHLLWDRGLESNIFGLKLCGAGGGGFLLGFTANWEASQTLLGQEEVELFRSL